MDSVSNHKAKIIEILRKECMILNETLLNAGISNLEIQQCYYRSIKRSPGKYDKFLGSNLYAYTTAIIVSIVLSLLLSSPIDKLYRNALGTRCIIPNNYLIWEATRPTSDCEYCRGVTRPIILNNVSQEEFKQYAYSSRPIIIKQAVANWPAAQVFNFSMLRDLYHSTPGSLDIVEQGCQFLHFKSEFASLKEVFEMPNARADFSEGTKPWYVGWSNCHPHILKELRKHYPRPHFLPDDSEMPNAEYVFFGYEQGAIMHLDYIPRLMWQAQLQGNKSWSLAPTPECDDQCEPMEFYVEAGDAVLVDTRVWYHATHIQHGDFSLTIQSEYG